MELLPKNEYIKLPAAQRHHFLKALTDKLPGFRLKGIQRFGHFGLALDTGTYEYEGCEFVYVPGDIARLGWEDFALGMDAATRTDMLETLSGYGVTDLEAFLKSAMSPVRTAAVPHMLVERFPRDIGWESVLLNEPAIWNSAEIRAAVEKFKRSNERCFISHNRYRLLKTDEGDVKFYLYKPVSYANFKTWVENLGFNLPTEDEWEYICGAGSKTLFRWGDSFNFNFNLKHFEDEDQPAKPYDLAQPNQFGVVIAHDPFMQEVIDGAPYFKGGDGGRYICGGAGKSLGYLPVATYFRDLDLLDDPLGYLDDIGGQYTCYRRILRLGA